jgi:Galactose oxidase, central domain
MPFFSRKKPPTQAPTQQPGPVCTWSAHAPQSGSSRSPFPRQSHTLTATANAAGELFLFGGYAYDDTSSDLYVISTRDFTATLLQTSGEVPTPRQAHGATLIGTTLSIYGGTNTNSIDANALSSDSLCLLNLGTSDILMSSPTPADHSFALQNRESGPALWSMVLGPILVWITPQTWSVPSSSSSVVGTARIISMIYGHSI